VAGHHHLAGFRHAIERALAFDGFGDALAKDALADAWGAIDAFDGLGDDLGLHLVLAAGDGFFKREAGESDLFAGIIEGAKHGVQLLGIGEGFRLCVGDSGLCILEGFDVQLGLAEFLVGAWCEVDGGECFTHQLPEFSDIVGDDFALRLDGQRDQFKCVVHGCVLLGVGCSELRKRKTALFPFIKQIENRFRGDHRPSASDDVLLPSDRCFNAWNRLFLQLIEMAVL
jgi:hypothetical protein